MAKAVSAPAAAKTKRFHEDSNTSWLHKSPARKQLSTVDKRKLERLGPEAVARKRPALNKHLDVGDEDLLKKSPSYPRKGVVCRPELLTDLAFGEESQ
jgi:hypothetical protein